MVTLLHPISFQNIDGQRNVTVAQESSGPRRSLQKPSLWRLRMPDHVLGDRGLRHRDCNLQQFSVNAGSSPARVGEAHFPDQIPNFWRYTRSSFKMATLPIPIPSKPLAMPGDDRLRLDQEQCRAPSFHNRESQTHRTRSAQRRRSLRPRLERCKTRS
jgi:hypothetical protein